MEAHNWAPIRVGSEMSQGISKTSNMTLFSGSKGSVSAIASHVTGFAKTLLSSNFKCPSDSLHASTSMGWHPETLSHEAASGGLKVTWGIGSSVYRCCTRPMLSL